MIHLSGKVSFDQKILVRAKASMLWRELEKAMLDSGSSKIWPNEFLTLLCDELEPHAIVEATFKWFFKKATYHYKICEFERGRRFTYRTLKDHIFTGDGEIEVIPKGQCAILRWRGEFEYEPAHAPQALLFKIYFRARFFAQLRENLRRLAKVPRVLRESSVRRSSP
jgi:hypothetical protein